MTSFQHVLQLRLHPFHDENGPTQVYNRTYECMELSMEVHFLIDEVMDGVLYLEETYGSLLMFYLLWVV